MESAVATYSYTGVRHWNFGFDASYTRLSALTQTIGNYGSYGVGHRRYARSEQGITCAYFVWMSAATTSPANNFHRNDFRTMVGLDLQPGRCAAGLVVGESSAVVNFAHAVRGRRPAKIGRQSARAAWHPNSFAQSRLADQQAQSLSQLRCIARSKEHAGFPVRHQLRIPAHARSHHRATARHRLHQRIGERLGKRRQHEYVDRPPAIRQRAE